MVAYEKTLAYKIPELAEQWDHTKNDKTPDQVTASNSYQAWWICPTCQHSWQQSVNNRKNGRGCPNCAGKILNGSNDFATTYPHLLHWWADERDPRETFKRSRTIIQWKCPQGHSFSLPVKSFQGKCAQCVENSVEKHSPHLSLEWSDKNTVTPEDVSYNSAQRVIWKCSACSHEWETPVYQRVNGTNCPSCSRSKQSSSQEDSLAKFFADHGLEEDKDFKRHVRGMINGNGELDFYLPDHKLAIEINGLFWHSEACGKDSSYHYDKWQSCKNQGIQLIQVWEDDYQNNPSLVHEMILHKMGITTREKVYARKTEVTTVGKTEAFVFLDTHHIQGKVQGSYYLGLKHDGKIVAVSVWTQRKESLYLERYATSQQVVGGLGKMLKHVLTLTEGITEVVTFAAHDVSNGHLYETLGFHVDKVLKPDYAYVYKKKRHHKFNFRISRFKNDPELNYQDGLTERELALLNKIPRVWDTGKIRYVLPVT